VLELDDLHDLAVHFESNAVAEIACSNHIGILLKNDQNQKFYIVYTNLI
jgi:hypothetical protein